MLIVATGVRGLVDSDFVRPVATVIDVGIHRTEHGITGDVVFDEVAQIADLITPVPGGVGPMTIAMLMRNTLRAAQLQGFDLGEPASDAVEVRTSSPRQLTNRSPGWRATHAPHPAPSEFRTLCDL